MERMVIAVDAMGGDNAPGAVCEGVKLALGDMADISILLYGPEEALKAQFPAGSYDANRLTIIDAPEVIDIHESPMLAVRRKVKSSMVMAMIAVKEGRAQAVLSAGSTGALLAGGMTRIGRIRGIDRPALATVLPGRTKPFVLIDSGANVDCQPQYITQFGMMGAIYAKQVLGVADPRVGLVNIGSESEKGNQLSKAAHALMAAQSVFTFAGNIEARDIPLGAADVIAADGFDGNILLKYTEGLAGALMGMLKDEMKQGIRSKLGAALMMPALRRFKSRMDYEEYGGAPFLGIEGALIKAHGSSGATAFKNAIRQARIMITGDVTGAIRSELTRLLPTDSASEKAPEDAVSATGSIATK